MLKPKFSNKVFKFICLSTIKPGSNWKIIKKQSSINVFTTVWFTGQSEILNYINFEIFKSNVLFTCQIGSSSLRLWIGLSWSVTNRYSSEFIARTQKITLDWYCWQCRTCQRSCLLYSYYLRGSILAIVFYMNC